jgi:hypothetical protein
VTGVRAHSRSVHALIGALALLAGLTGCSSDKPASTPTTTSPTSAATPEAAPPNHACYDLTLAEVTAPTTTADPVPCSARHTATTIRVGTINPVVDGHLLAIDSDTVQQQIATRCRTRFAAYVGGNRETQRLGRLTVIWFSPSLAEGDRGARWFRCDVVALAGRDRLAPLPRSIRGILDRDGALDKYGTCGTSAPAASRFQRVICSRRHTWRARATIEVPDGAKYLGKAAGAAANSACRDIDTKLAADILKLQWSFEWPTRDQWENGQRYGYCWTPDPA